MQKPSKSTAAITLACLAFAGGLQTVAGQGVATPGPFRVKPSEVAVPPGVKLGEYQRTIRPFQNWTLICDENLTARQKVCNVSQVITDANGRLAFSWSLAATRDGKPYMIVRTAPDARKDGPVSLTFRGRKRPVEVRLDGCSATVCVGMLPVGPIMRRQIAEGTSPTVSYETADGRVVTLTAPLKELSTALAAIN